MGNVGGEMTRFGISGRSLSGTNAFNEVLRVQRGGIFRVHVLALHSEAGRRVGLRVPSAFELGIDLESKAVNDHCTVGAIVGFAVWTIIGTAGLVIPPAGGAASSTVAV